MTLFVNNQFNLNLYFFSFYVAPQDRLVLSKLRAQYFKFPINIINLQINRATLWLYLNGSNINKPETDGHVVLYQIVRGTTSLKIVSISNWNSYQTFTLTLIFLFILYFNKAHKRKVNNSLVRRGGWIKIELKNVVQRWFEAPETNLGLAIHSYDSDGNTLSVIHHEDVLFESPMVRYLNIELFLLKYLIKTFIDCRDHSLRFVFRIRKHQNRFDENGWQHWIVRIRVPKFGVAVIH